MSEFDPLGILRRLLDDDVRFVVIGGFAGNLRGSANVTQDLDICYARDDDNLEHLAQALRTLNARLRVRSSKTWTSRSNSTLRPFAWGTRSRSSPT